MAWNEPEEDFFEEGDEVPEVEPTWQAPVTCPRCHQDDTRLVDMRFEVSVYECETCHVRF